MLKENKTLGDIPQSMSGMSLCVKKIFCLFIYNDHYKEDLYRLVEERLTNERAIIALETTTY